MDSVKLSVDGADQIEQEDQINQNFNPQLAQENFEKVFRIGNGELDKVNEVQVMNGVYFTDYRNPQQKLSQKLQNLENQKCFQEIQQSEQLLKMKRNKKKYNAKEINNLLILEENYEQFESEIQGFKESIKIIMEEEENFIEDKIYVDAIQENFSVIDDRYQFLLEIIDQILVLDSGHSLMDKIPELKKEKENNLKEEQKFYIMLDEHNNEIAKKILEKFGNTKEEAQQKIKDDNNNKNSEQQNNEQLEQNSHIQNNMDVDQNENGMLL
ncbi:hypothetical protein PPERSA_11843 [Pseudocohnilembus persalinus]|uniref:Uncharacterized protein n=1 Tax=Pseudocohnilembus persalinus TaxID=266149 RepID=A0A0V0QJT2_PSEPJ|nr:hypothetical protein PPERSA_11843 [Pseudocohnilembus persalinus]|eukprot:KRX02503.1 hypothetical protein PPERSA_11843 [Pseudocohnilembus persalinus]